MTPPKRHRAQQAAAAARRAELKRVADGTKTIPEIAKIIGADKDNLYTDLVWFRSNGITIPVAPAGSANRTAAANGALVARASVTIPLPRGMSKEQISWALKNPNNLEAQFILGMANHGPLMVPRV